MTSDIKRVNTREINFDMGMNPYAAGSCIVNFGNTKVHVTASVDSSIPPWLKGKGSGWVTAEYSMLPGSTHDRVKRDRKSVPGRSQEIQRLIGRSLRAAVDMKLLGERQIIVDCDVLVADGGTRCASITGGYVALKMAIDKLIKNGELNKSPLINQVAALSVGINKSEEVIADLNYEEDSSCHTDLNIVFTKNLNLIEIQGTAEGKPFSMDQLNSMLSCSQEAIKQVLKAQDDALYNHRIQG